MPQPLEKSDKIYTYADYLNWDEDDRIEIIDGKPIMQGTPSRKHQKVSGEIFFQLRQYLEGKQCEVYAAPFTVRLFEKDEDTPNNIKTVVEPDIVVVCDKNKLDEKGCKGAPDFIIEILSPSTARYDLIWKLNKYQEAGVKEYWIVSPGEQTVQTLQLKGGVFQVVDVYTPPAIVPVSVLNSCYIDLSKVFTE